jgi:hypothetical protein
MTHPRTDASLLIVDDEPANVLLLERILERAGFYLSVNVSADTATSPTLLAAVHEVPARRLVLTVRSLEVGYAQGFHLARPRALPMEATLSSSCPVARLPVQGALAGSMYAAGRPDPHRRWPAGVGRTTPPAAR